MAKFLVLDYTEAGKPLQVRINLNHLVEVQDIILNDGSLSRNKRYILSNGSYYDACGDVNYFLDSIVEL